MRRVNKNQKVRINLTLNGRKMGAETEPRTLLSDFLRHSLGATGTHVGCEHGVCGACTVIVDDKPIFSCITPCSSVQGKEVRTVEGLGTADQPSALQKAFIEKQAAQCGYCIAGMLMRAQALLERNRNPDRQTITAHMAPNLCRCGTHLRIIDAIRAVAASGADHED